jgi:hypothetical protein
MKISIDTKEDSHEEIKKVISLLSHLVGHSQDIVTNSPTSFNPEPADKGSNPFASMFGDSSEQSLTDNSKNDSQSSSTESFGSESIDENTSDLQGVQQPVEASSEAPSDSTEALFSELFSEDEINKMDEDEHKQDDEQNDSEETEKPSVEFY